MNHEFAEYVKDHIREYLPPEYQDAAVSLNEVTKSNDRMLTGLTVLRDGERAAPAIYLEPLAEQVEKGRPLDSVMREIAETELSYKGRIPLEVPSFDHYESVRPMLSIQLCDPEANREYLKDKPHTPCGVLAAFYRIQVEANHEGNASAPVTENLMRLWGITKEQLHKDAVQAETARNPVCFYSMEDVMSEIMLSSAPENLFGRTEPLETGFTPMYVLTNQNKVNGAGVLARDGVPEKIGELVGSSYYVLPSSIHEVLIVPDNGRLQAKELEDMVKEINATQVAPEERLSDKVQYYDRAARTLGRKQEKGLLEQLADKKAQVQKAKEITKTKQAHRDGPSL